MVYVCGPMNSDNPVAACFNSMLARPIGRCDLAAQHFERVDHDVSHALNPIRPDTLVSQIQVGVWRWCPQEISDGIGENSIDFLGHGAIEAAKAGLKMRNRQKQLFGNDGCGHGGVYIAHDDDPVGPRKHAYILVCNHDRRRLFGVAGAADAQ